MPYRNQQDHDLPPELEVAVGIYDTPHDAHLAILHLETLGIPARTVNELLVGMAPHLGGGSAGIRVLVREDLAAEAHAALEALRLELRHERQRRAHAAAKAQGNAPWPRVGLLVVGGALLTFAWYLVR
ncbi:MAG TPA: hypothetical protein VFU02_14030 [Polyangiaceae bacterium]|nr:hypothetical protein [Polyangiaceae bacterium]